MVDCNDTCSEGGAVRVRFAPSPTGMLHVGGARTAIYNWAFARAKGGTFVLRIEDTDTQRSTDENTRIIIDAMRWLGLDWDEGPQVGGEFGPYFQTQRTQTYRAALERLKERGAVYPCFCTKEQLDAKRAAAEASEGGYAGYDRTCRNIDPAEAKRRIDAGEPHVWRLKVPENHGPIVFDDMVYGSMSFPADVMDDMILCRTDGTFTYNFAVVCDDANMQISHVVRGDDHLSNTPRQILIYEALGLEHPVFGHLPMILGENGKKLSKRHGDTSVEEFRDRGYLADTMVNFLALLGWSLDGETTIIPRDVLCGSFDAARIQRKDAVFDTKKLDWMNGVYIREMGAASWALAARPWIEQAMAQGYAAEPKAIVVEPAADGSPSAATAPSPDDVAAAQAAFADDPSWFEQLYPLVAERLVRLDEIPDKLRFLFWGQGCVLDGKSVQKVLLKDGARAQEALGLCRQVLADTSVAWDAETLQLACRNLGEAAGIKPKLLFQPLRVAVAGNMVSPPLFESIVLMERSDVLGRIDNAAAVVFPDAQ
ncbi:glutamate--tRNA ligase [Adlercreutzia aquisgranensis]|uniref:glutamate--tRNA ligase n=1 Tax=Adlercreutzia aquisgranensis TaxID=2941323 RepID=UPI00203C5582|nr:glutamate--tRNA ligase [Adlercreutzia aquisgranensis]